jgi:hypothetical protein
MDKLMELIVELKTRDFKITKTTKGIEQLQQTQRNNLKAELVATLLADIKSQYEYAYRTKDGIMLEIANDSIANGITNENGSGAITITLDIKVNDLETNAENDSQDYEIAMSEKADKKAKADKVKADKIERDKARREKGN